MKYYRLALQDRETSIWTWKTTVLTSLQAVFQSLKIYRPLLERIRVFCATSKEELKQMLDQVNTCLMSVSVTAAQFLRDRHMQGDALEQSAEERGAGRRAVLTTAPVEMRARRERPADMQAAASLEQKRLEHELGPGGDHDRPYCFTLPETTPQLLAWVRLQTRVRVKELQS